MRKQCGRPFCCEGVFRSCAQWDRLCGGLLTSEACTYALHSCCLLSLPRTPAASHVSRRRKAAARLFDEAFVPEPALSAKFLLQECFQRLSLTEDSMKLPPSAEVRERWCAGPGCWGGMCGRLLLHHGGASCCGNSSTCARAGWSAVVASHASPQRICHVYTGLRESLCNTSSVPRRRSCAFALRLLTPLALWTAAAGEWDFYTITLGMRAPVLIPRPETEQLVERILRDIRQAQRTHDALTILDVGCGTGTPA
jgi:hypothetical protein